MAACMALFAMNRDDTLEFTVKILLQADEDLRRTAAELLTLDPFEGYSVLKDGISQQDLLVRRAVVFGLGLLRNDWSRNLLQQLQASEAQWVVRTAAVQALESLDSIDPAIPHKILEPHLSPWLIQAASNNGEGISPGIQPIGLLLKLLDNGTDEEKHGVLDYLSLTDQESVIVRIYDVMFSQQDQIREAAFYTCWRLSLSGVEFPSTKKYGFQ
jgi:HEAT repeat protein